MYTPSCFNIHRKYEIYGMFMPVIRFEDDYSIEILAAQTIVHVFFGIQNRFEWSLKRDFEVCIHPYVHFKARNSK